MTSKKYTVYRNDLNPRRPASDILYVLRLELDVAEDISIDFIKLSLK